MAFLQMDSLFVGKFCFWLTWILYLYQVIVYYLQGTRICFLELNVYGCVILKFGEGAELPSTYAFALAEHHQSNNTVRLRINLSGDRKSVV